jgi:16S rRNA (cytidine1402-2'-O)-methyltransferase
MLYLLPNALHESQRPPQYIEELVKELDGVICENEKVARAFLKHYVLKMPLQSFPLLLLNEHTKPEELDALIQPLVAGQNWGLLTDAGLSCIADPGQPLVALARRKKIAVSALYGPCSIIMALQLSGFSGQRFSFNGYLPREKAARQSELKRFEKLAKSYDQTQIFIEAPYRNKELMADCIETLSPDTPLAVAWDLTAPTEEVIVKKVALWKKDALPDIHKKPAIFLLHW